MILCLRCKKLEDIDVEGYVSCLVHCSTKLKVYCKYFEPKNEESEQVGVER